MKVAIVVSANRSTGYGHYHRCRALADALVTKGHTVVFVGDIDSRIPGVRNFHAHTEVIASEWLLKILPHWVVFDAPGETPDWVYSDLWRTMVVDGVGHPSTAKAHLVISQGMKGEFSAPEYLMLRPELNFVSRSHYRRKWLVFGGGYDEMGLCRTFSQKMADESAWLIAPPDFRERQNKNHWLDCARATTNIASLYGVGEQACLSMGMTVWEMLYLRVPCYVFSKTDRHLESAKLMGEWLHYWPETGVPAEYISEFLSLPPKLSFPELDLKGAYRVAELMVTYG